MKKLLFLVAALALVAVTTTHGAAHDDGFITSTHSIWQSSGEGTDHHFTGLGDCNVGKCIGPDGELTVRDYHAWGGPHSGTAYAQTGGAFYLQVIRPNLITFCPEGATNNASNVAFDMESPFHYHGNAGATLYLSCAGGGRT